MVKVDIPRAARREDEDARRLDEARFFDKSLERLKPGKVFAFRVRIHGGRKTVSDWSDVVMQRVM